ncbi:site-specific integrase [Methylobacterium sp. WL103]|uniref:site-specific integrase n=1 Tax=Methylobacterium sp. WL103 TaxID=2603891 RepID=UPI001FED659F|nr:site-specific integrase [Methylobacterium sp. WL103]
MAQPWPHPKTRVFWFRRAVPKDLRDLVGKREELFSLETKDPAEARVRYAKRSAEVEARWANLRGGARTLTEREAHALATSAHEQWLYLHHDDPSFQVGWHTDLYPTLWTAVPLPETEAQPGVTGTVPITNLFYRSMRHRCFAEADRILARNGLVVDEWSRTKLARAVGVALQRASLTLGRAAQGEIGLDDSPAHDSTREADGHVGAAAPSIPTPSRALTQRGGPKPLSLTGLFDAWWQEAKGAGRKPSTHESYDKTVRYLIAFLKHDDATQVTAEDIVAFKDYRLATPSKRTGKVPSAKTVKDSDLAALKTLFGWAVINRKLPANPASGLTIKIGKRQRVRAKGFVEVEVHAILSAALHYVAGEHENPRTAAAKRWLPWLCAFSGARVGEMGQLRRQDLRREGDLWIINITPEAGTVKTDEARDVVLHQQLVELGFPSFVAASAEGPLFLTPGKGGDVLGPLAGLLNRMREFVRPIVPDPNVQPNHGWRHLFTTICEEAEINPRVYNAIMGHAGRTVAESYGDVTLKAKAIAICKLPSFDLDKLRAITGRG